MNNYNELLQKISSVNAQVQTLNKERQVNLGKKQALETQLSTAIANYKASYGVDLTPETVEAEYNKVLAEKQAEVAKLETTLSAIKQGNFEEAQVEVQQANVNVPQANMVSPVNVEMPQAQVETPKATITYEVDPALAPKVEMPQTQPTMVEKPVNVEVPQTQPNVVQPARVEMPQADVTQPAMVEQTHVVAPTPTPAPHVEAPTPQPVTVPISQAAAPTPAPAPTQQTMTPVSSTPVSAPPINFNSILSGTDFQ